MKTSSRLALYSLIVISVTSHAFGQAGEPPDFLSEEKVQKFLNQHLSNKPKWYGLYMSDQKVGFVKYRLSELPDHDPPAIEVRVEMTFSYQREAQVIEAKMDITEIFDKKDPYQAQRITQQKTIGKFIEQIDVRRNSSNHGYTVQITQAGKTREQAIDMDYKLTESLMTDLWCAVPRAVGDKITYKQMDATELRVNERSARVTEVTNGVDGGVGVGMVKIEVAEKDGMAYDQMFLSDGTAIEFGLGEFLVGRLESEEMAQNNQKAINLFFENSMVTDGAIDDPSLVTRMEVEVSPELYKVLPQTSSQQKTFDKEKNSHRVTIDYSKLQNDRATPEEERLNLEATVAYPADHKKIIELAQQAVGDAATTEEKITALVHFVSEFVEDSYTAEPLTVLDTITIRKGDCTEHADLFTTLARSLRIPARSVSGFVYTGDENTGAFGGHAWNEVVLDGAWIAVDTAWDETTINATHIRGDLDESMKTLPPGQKIVLLSLDGSPWHRTNTQVAAEAPPRDGPFITYYENGQKKSEVHFKNGKSHGRIMSWYESGQKEMDGQCRNGKMEGLSTMWYVDGQKWIEVQYKNGEVNGPETWYYTNGQKMWELHYKNGNLDGRVTYWYGNGQKEWEGRLKDGEKDGQQTYWYENGQKQQEADWKDGKLLSTSAWMPKGKPCPLTKIVDGSGTLALWHENGLKKVEIHYKDGEEVSRKEFSAGADSE